MLRKGAALFVWEMVIAGVGLDWRLKGLATTDSRGTGRGFASGFRSGDVGRPMRMRIRTQILMRMPMQMRTPTRMLMRMPTQMPMKGLPRSILIVKGL